MELINKYFPDLTDKQHTQVEALGPLYREWNAMINVISRKDIDNLYLHHILHSMAIYPFFKFKEGSRILDLGTGGGFPGIPLAILFPGVHFHLIDARAKKLKVVEAIASQIGLENLSTEHARAESHKKKYDFVLSRAVTSLQTLCSWSFPLIKKESQNAMPNGVWVWKGGDLKEEIKGLRKGDYYEIFEIHKRLPEPYFEEKYLIYIQA